MKTFIVWRHIKLRTIASLLSLLRRVENYSISFNLFKRFCDCSLDIFRSDKNERCASKQKKKVTHKDLAHPLWICRHVAGYMARVVKFICRVVKIIPILQYFLRGLFLWWNEFLKSSEKCYYLSLKIDFTNFSKAIIRTKFINQLVIISSFIQSIDHTFHANVCWYISKTSFWNFLIKLSKMFSWKW